MPVIQAICAREILDSRGFPTVEAEVTFESGEIGFASVPSGASTGSKEALELRDAGERYMGKGVQKAVAHINQDIAKLCCGQDFDSQQALDSALIELDGTENKSKLGANAMLAVSLAYARAMSIRQSLPLYESIAQSTPSSISLPVPLLNILNGGAHADNSVDIQEFMIMPVGASDWSQALQMGVEVYHALKQVLKDSGLSTTVGDEGGFAPNLSSNQEALDKIMAAIEVAGLKPGEDIYLALDVAANELYRNNHYHFHSENKQYTASQLVDVYEGWVNAYPILSIEDAMEENDMLGWQEITQRLGGTIQLVGDDVFVTNPKLLKQGIEDSVANAILIKLNQIGTLTETLETIKIAKQAGYQTIISHRSGETEDAFIADLAVGCGAGQIKTGAPARVDRIAKYNQLTRIAEKSNTTYSGRSHFQRWIKS
tara:strand:+ start:190393 stop:191679 length:1287 start_codon:yes stop_codon:yes gene_type:complete